MGRLAALKNGDSIDFWRNDDPKCPHCGKVVGVVDSELWHLYEEGDHDIECDDCGLPFMVSTQVTHSFSTDEQEEEDTRDAGNGEGK